MGEVLQSHGANGSVHSYETVPKKKRMVEQDIAKGICIFCVVFVHCVPMTKDFDLVARALFGYCMPVFFVLAGYNYRPGKRTTWENIKRRTKQIIIPLLKYSLIIIALIAVGLFFIKGPEQSVSMIKAYIGLWLTDPIATWCGLHTIGTFQGIERVFEPYWFLLYLVSASVIFFIVADFAYRSKENLVAVIVTLVLITMVFNAAHIVLPWAFQNAPCYAALMLVGCALKQYDILTKGLEQSWRNVWFWVTMVLVVGSGLLFPRMGQISGSGQLTLVGGLLEIPYTVIYAALATYFVIMLSGFVKHLVHVGKFLEWFGFNSLLILIFHLIYVFIAKAIVGAELNASLSFVTSMNIVDIAAFVIAIALICVHLYIHDRVVERKAQRKGASAA